MFTYFVLAQTFRCIPSGVKNHTKLADWKYWHCHYHTYPLYQCHQHNQPLFLQCFFICFTAPNTRTCLVSSYWRRSSWESRPAMSHSTGSAATCIWNCLGALADLNGGWRPEQKATIHVCKAMKFSAHIYMKHFMTPISETHTHTHTKLQLPTKQPGNT